MGNSGEVLKKNGPARPATRVTMDSICGSLTPHALKIGVSTSSTPRAAKNSRVRITRAARCRKAARLAVGRQSPPRGASGSPLTRHCRGLGPTARLNRRAAADARRARSVSNSKITVEPMLKRPSSAPFSSTPPRPAMWVTTRRAAGVISPAQTVAMLPTLSAPTNTTANRPKSLSKSVSTRSLRAKSCGTRCAVASFTLNRRPGTYTVSSNRPRRAACELGDN